MNNFIKQETTLYLEHEGYTKLKGKLKNGAETLLDLLEVLSVNSLTESMYGAINKFKKIEYMAYSEVNFCAKKLAEFLSKITKPREIIGIASLNRPEWVIAEFATYYANCVNSPLYTTFKEEALSYIMSSTEMRILVAAPSFAKIVIDRVFGYIPKDLIKLEHIILMENDQEITDLCLSKGLSVTSLNEILFTNLKKDERPFYFDFDTTICAKVSKYYQSKGIAEKISINRAKGIPKPEDVASICFTSGTTGVPKGVQLTHRNFIYQIESYLLTREYYDVTNFNENDVYLSYLPLSHVFERIIFYLCVSAHAKVVFFRGDKTKIGEDLQIAKPSILSVVPKVLQSFQEKIEKEISIKKFYERIIFRNALNFKLFLQEHGIFSAGLLDKIVFSKVAQAFGGRIHTILCGGAAIDPDLIRYMRAILGASIFQGYGQTEGLGANAICTTSMNDPASIGIPFPATRFKLVNIGADENIQEKALFLKGYSITKGLEKPPVNILDRLLSTGKFSFKIENINESLFDSDGWMNTGDVVIYENKKLYIVGRSKDLVKLDNGEYISPENIENRMRQTDFIKDIFISKIPKQDKLVALVSIPNEGVSLVDIANYLKQGLSELVEQKIVPRCVDITKFAILKQCFSDVEDGVLLTPTLKKKRFIFLKKFKDLLLNAYSIDDIMENDSQKVLKNTRVEFK